MNDVSGLERNLHSRRAQGSGRNDHAGGNAQIRQRLGQIESELDSKNTEPPDKIFCRVGNVRETVLFVRPVHQGNVERNPVGATQNFDLGMLATFVEVEAVSKKRQASGGRAIHAQYDVLNLQTRLVR